MKKISKHWYINDGLNMSAVLGLCFFLNCFFIIAMKKFGIGEMWLFNKTVDSDLPYSCIFAPITEEFIFRWLPLGLLMRMFSKNPQIFEKTKWHWAALLSILFAFNHQYHYWAIYMQGIGGFFLCYLYFNNRYGYASAVICHSLWNLSLGYILPTVGYFNDSSNSWF